MATLVGPGMSTTPGPPPGAQNDLDQLLGDLCEALQISPAQYANAEQKYKAVGKWLSEPGSAIAKLKPNIFPQGSIALQTTVRPWTDEDSYDLDFVLQVEPTSDAPMTLYNLVKKRLLESDEYRDRVELKKRCLCLNFEEEQHSFHMDILPARADEVRGGTCIEIPDRKTKDWEPSNPKGYREWFESRATREALLLMEKRQEPLPDNDPAYAKGVLRRAVQLMKRRRDLLIKRDLAPRSVVLTTLAATHYHGERHLAQALQSILGGIRRDIEVAQPNRIVVCNPTNPDERFCESLATDEQYDAFVAFIDTFSAEVAALTMVTGIPNLQLKLSSMFGERITKRALMEYGNRVSASRDRGDLGLATKAAKAGLIVGGTTATASQRAPVAVPKNTFYGGE